MRLGKFIGVLSDKKGALSHTEFRESTKLMPSSKISEGGFLMEEFDMEKISKMASRFGDKTLYAIELNYVDATRSLGFKFPVHLAWAELLDGSPVSADVFERPVRDFVFFGDTMSWYKLALNDDDPPLSIWVVVLRQVSIRAEKSPKPREPRSPM